MTGGCARRRTASIRSPPSTTSIAPKESGVDDVEPVPGSAQLGGTGTGTNSIGGTTSESTSVVVVAATVEVVAVEAVVVVPESVVVVPPTVVVVTGTVVVAAAVVVGASVVVGATVVVDAGGGARTVTTFESVEPEPGSTRSIFHLVDLASSTRSQNDPLASVVATNGPNRSRVAMSVANNCIEMSGG